MPAGSLKGGRIADSILAFEKTTKGVPVPILVNDALDKVQPDPGHVLDGDTVERLCQRLRDSAELLSNDPLITTAVDRADAFHYLLTTLAGGVDQTVAQCDPYEPMFSPVMAAHRMDWGARNPDGVYRRAIISSDLQYRVRGQIGSAVYFTFDFVGAEYTTEGGFLIEVSDLDVDGDGNFEFVIGGERIGDAWFPLPVTAQGIVTREFFDDWSMARRTRLRIDCLSPVPGEHRRREHDPARVAAEFAAIGDWVYEGGIRHWLQPWHAPDRLEQTENAFMPTAFRTGTPRPTYQRGCWQLGADEALIIEFPDLQAEYWGLQMASVLVHTLDFAGRTTSINSRQVDVDSDGVVRLVVSHTDPGAYNWLDTTGLEHGELLLRTYRAKVTAVPSTRLVAAGEVLALLPTSRRCSAEERRAQIAERREGVATMICD
jgi:hypothetical protein